MSSGNFVTKLAERPLASKIKLNKLKYLIILHPCWTQNNRPQLALLPLGVPLLLDGLMQVLNPLLQLANLDILSGQLFGQSFQIGFFHVELLDLRQLELQRRIQTLHLLGQRLQSTKFSACCRTCSGYTIHSTLRTVVIKHSCSQKGLQQFLILLIWKHPVPVSKFVLSNVSRVTFSVSSLY